MKICLPLDSSLELDSCVPMFTNMIIVKLQISEVNRCRVMRHKYKHMQSGNETHSLQDSNFKPLLPLLENGVQSFWIPLPSTISNQLHFSVPYVCFSIWTPLQSKHTYFNWQLEIYCLLHLGVLAGWSTNSINRITITLQFGLGLCKKKKSSKSNPN